MQTDPTLQRFMPLSPDLSVQAHQFDEAWHNGEMPKIDEYLAKLGEDRDARRKLLLELMQIDIECRWRQHSTKSAAADETEPLGLRIEDYLSQYDELDSLEQIPLEVVKHEYRVRRMCGDRPSFQEYYDRFPHLAGQIDVALSSVDLGSQRVSHESTKSRVPQSVESTHVTDEESKHCGSPKSGNPRRALPDRVGRYELEQFLDGGGFADVYLARDGQLKRSVAVKIARPEYRNSPATRDAYLDEAGKVAQLDHPHIVPVYDVGQTEDGDVYFVCKYIRGSNLAKLLQHRRLTTEQCVDLLAKVAEALHHAHKRGLVHRDIKPANMLVDDDGTPYVADFGLAVREDQQREHAGELAGTVPYMAPEQVRGDVHRMDGRVDVWALGVILYEALTGRRPFAGETQDELFDEILNRDPKPLRQIDDEIPFDLEQITLKCLAKRPPDRYTTCRDLADALTSWLSNPQPNLEPPVSPPLSPDSVDEHPSVAVCLLRRSPILRLSALLFSGVVPNLFLTVILLLYYKVMLGYKLDSQVPLWVNSACYGTAIIVGLVLGWRVVFQLGSVGTSAPDRTLRQCLTLPAWMSFISFVLWFVGAGMVAKFGDGTQAVNVYLSFVGANFLAGSIAASLVFYTFAWITLNLVQLRHASHCGPKLLRLLLVLCSVHQYVLGVALMAMLLVLFLGYEETGKSVLLRYIFVASVVFTAICFLTITAVAPRIRSTILLLAGYSHHTADQSSVESPRVRS